MMKLINGLKERLSKVYNNLKEIKAERNIKISKIFEMIINFDTVKNPGEFIRLNQKTINDGIDIFKKLLLQVKNISLLKETVNLLLMVGDAKDTNLSISSLFKEFNFMVTKWLPELICYIKK